MMTCESTPAVSITVAAECRSVWNEIRRTPGALARPVQVAEQVAMPERGADLRRPHQPGFGPAFADGEPLLEEPSTPAVDRLVGERGERHLWNARR